MRKPLEDFETFYTREIAPTLDGFAAERQEVARQARNRALMFLPIPLLAGGGIVLIAFTYFWLAAALVVVSLGPAELWNRYRKRLHALEVKQGDFILERVAARYDVDHARIGDRLVCDRTRDVGILPAFDHRVVHDQVRGTHHGLRFIASHASLDRGYRDRHNVLRYKPLLKAAIIEVEWPAPVAAPARFVRKGSRLEEMLAVDGPAVGGPAVNSPAMAGQAQGLYRRFAVDDADAAARAEATGILDAVELAVEGAEAAVCLWPETLTLVLPGENPLARRHDLDDLLANAHADARAMDASFARLLAIIERLAGLSEIQAVPAGRAQTTC